MDINESVSEIHATAVEKGWWDGKRQKLALHMLMVTEVGEASQCVRKGDPLDGADGKPEGEAAELADVVLRVMDYFGHEGWDLAAMLRRKMDYNKTRTARHDAETA